MGCCNGNCASCGGCAKTLLLSDGEIAFLNILGQIPFLPVARKADDMTPVYLEDDAPEHVGTVLQALEAKGLIDLDYSRPLGCFDMYDYDGYPVHGTIALTAKGQTVVDLLDKQGIEET